MAIDWTDARQRSASLESATESATQLASNLRRAALAARDAYVAEMTRSASPPSAGPVGPELE